MCVYMKSTIMQLITTVFATGFYWIDPNGGCSNDAVEVHCNFSGGVPKTCLLPVQKKAERKNWEGESIWFSLLEGGFQVGTCGPNPITVICSIPFLLNASFGRPHMIYQETRCSSLEPVPVRLPRISSISVATQQHLLSFVLAMGMKLLPAKSSMTDAR